MGRTVRASRLSTWLDCPLRAHLDSQAGRESRVESVATVYGTLTEIAAKRIIMHGRVPSPADVDAWQRQRVGFVEYDQTTPSASALHAQVVRGGKAMASAAATMRSILSPESIDWEPRPAVIGGVADRLELTGTGDAFGKTADGKCVVLDFKTTRNIADVPEKVPGYHAQLGAYARLYVGEGYDAPGAFAAALVFVGRGDDSGKAAGVEVNPDVCVSAFRNAIAAAAAFDPCSPACNPGFLCKRCDWHGTAACPATHTESLRVVG